jgi:hypothetical protein
MSWEIAWKLRGTFSNYFFTRLHVLYFRERRDWLAGSTKPTAGTGPPLCRHSLFHILSTLLFIIILPFDAIYSRYWQCREMWHKRKPGGLHITGVPSAGQPCRTRSGLELREHEIEHDSGLGYGISSNNTKTSHEIPPTPPRGPLRP